MLATLAGKSDNFVYFLNLPLDADTLAPLGSRSELTALASVSDNATILYFKSMYFFLECIGLFRPKRYRNRAAGVVSRLG